MTLIRRMPAGAPVALIALAAYGVLTLAMPAGGARTGLAALLPLAGLGIAVAVAIARLPRAGADHETTRRVFEMAGAFVIASPILAVAVHMTR